jgi:type I restriction enzyme M protein
LNKNKKAQTKKVGEEKRQYRDRRNQILFMDLRQMGEPFEKKFTQFAETDIQTISGTYHNWQSREIENIAEFCYSASIDEIIKKDFSLVPSKYIEFVNRDENINFEEKMNALKSEFAELIKAEEESKNELMQVFENLGYKIELS